MAEDTLIKIEADSKSSQNLNFKNIGQNLIIQACFHQLQSLLQKSKQGSILLIVLQTSICKSCHIGRIGHDKEVTINLGKSHDLMIVFDVTESVIIDSQEKSCQHQGLNNRRQLRLTSVFDKKHAFANLLCKNFDELVILTKIAIVKHQALTRDRLNHASLMYSSSRFMASLIVSMLAA
ncbi:Uncharacterised protein [Streptococcus pneumoniae]|nr:Uncharacterised protein [Streptococcus pneumoniae]CKH85807.1 Uncharacterised protein [Streptococcus pneumoniae]